MDSFDDSWRMNGRENKRWKALVTATVRVLGHVLVQVQGLRVGLAAEGTDVHLRN
jgi:hypothetical protein